jgi:hypothetical protein
LLASDWPSNSCGGKPDAWRPVGGVRKRTSTSQA